MFKNVVFGMFGDMHINNGCFVETVKFVGGDIVNQYTGELVAGVNLVYIDANAVKFDMKDGRYLTKRDNVHFLMDLPCFQ